MNQNPNLLLSLDLSTYSWIWAWSTGSSTTSRVLNETYLLGSKSCGLVRSAPLRALQASISLIWIIHFLLSRLFVVKGVEQFFQTKGPHWCWYFHRDRKSFGMTLIESLNKIYIRIKIFTVQSIPINKMEG